MLRLDELAVRPLDGSAFVEGALGLYAASGEPVMASAPGQPIGIACRRPGGRPATFSLFDKVVQAPDGFHEAGPPSLHVDLGETVPDLFSLLSFSSEAARHRISADEVRLVNVRWQAPQVHERGHRDLYADGYEIDLSLAVEEGGLRIAFEGPVEPSRYLPEQTLPFEKATVRANLLVPAAYCRLQGFNLPIRFPGSGYEATGPWAPTDPGLGSIAVNSGGAPYCPGTLDWQDPHDWAFTGPFVQLNLRAHELVARPVASLNRLPSGFAIGTGSWSDGPKMMLYAGFEDWSRMLWNREEAEIALEGAGIGHVDGQTGRSVGECGGPKRQPIRRLMLRLKRSREGLLVSGQGELEPLAAADTGTSLGPELRFEFLIPRAWILARGLDIPHIREERKKEFPGAETW